MSQAKVDRYKKEKANRKRTMQKEKIERYTYGIIGAVVAVAVISWAGYSFYSRANGADASGENSSVEINTDAIDDYLSGLGGE